MTKRTLLAKGVLAALLLASGAMQAGATRAGGAADARNAAEHTAAPRWMYVTGEEPGPYLVLGCSSGSPWRAAACVALAL